MISRNNLAPQSEQLFNPSSFDDKTEIQLIDGHEVPTTYGPEGSCVDTVERAQYLVNALNAISQRNIRNGISLAAYTEQHGDPIWRRYRQATYDVLDGASRNREAYHQELRVNFWRATGYAAMREMQDLKKIMPPQQINPRAQKMWEDFNHAYGNPQKVKERNKYKKALQVQVDSGLDEQLRLV